MSEPKRQHMVAAITQLLQAIRQNWITLLVLLFVGSGSDSIFVPLLIIGFALLGFVGGILSWWRFTYYVVDGELRINQGVFVRKNLYLSRDRIQVIDISAGIVQRIFGLVSIEVKTAGSSSKEAKIDAITRREAERLKQLLRKNEAVTGEEQADEIIPQKIYHLSYKELFITASTSGNLGIALSIVAGVFSQVDQIIDEEQMFAFIESVIPASIGVSLVISTILFLLVVSWLLSFFGTLIKYYDFTLTVKDEELHIKHGLFEQKQLTVPFNRIQGIQIKEDLLRQPLGYASVILESAGYGGDQQQLNSTTLYPLIKTSEVHAFIQNVIPEYDVETDGIKPPKVAMRRYLLRMVWISLAVIAPAWAFIPYGVFSWFLLIPALILGYAQYKDARVGIDDGSMVLSSRLLSRTTAIIKKYRVQSAITKGNPFQRRLGLVSYAVTVASGSSGQTFGIRELDSSDGQRILEWISPVKPVNNQDESDNSLPRLSDPSN